MYDETLFRTRGYLPHLEIPDSTYFVTIRLADTLPQNILFQIRLEIKDLAAKEKKNSLTSAQQQRLKYLESRKIQDYLDRSLGDCFLKDPAVAEIVKEAVNHHDGKRYISHVCCLMPNHLHWIFTPLKTEDMNKSSSLISIVQGFKSFTAHCINKMLKRNGSFWRREYYDHRIKSSEEFYKLVLYTIGNPIKAKLCSDWKEWPWTFCSAALQSALDEVT
jgi:REP element-mobilizing transposase RayT